LSMSWHVEYALPFSALSEDKLETAKNIGFSTRVLSRWDVELFHWSHRRWDLRNFPQLWGWGSSMEILTLDVADRKAFKDRIDTMWVTLAQHVLFVQDDIETLRMNALQARLTPFSAPKLPVVCIDCSCCKYITWSEVFFCCPRTSLF
jgi:hypothetical protein